MLDRFRSLVKRLELPPEEDSVVYRIIDNDLNAVEVTPSGYAVWRMQNDVTERAIVGQDTVENVTVRTTFSIMPESRSYKPFGTSAYEIPSFDPRAEYSRRYDTWGEAEQGHRNTLERIRRDSAIARAAEQKAEDLAGTAGEVRLAISAGLPALFRVSINSGIEVTVLTPMLRADGACVELTVSESGSGFVLTGTDEASSGDLAPALGELGDEQVGRLCRSLGLSVESGALVCKADDASQLGQAMISLAQAIAYLSYIKSVVDE